MITIDFSRLEVFADIAKTRCQVVDFRHELAESIYNMGRGIVAHALALKIYNSKGRTEYNDEEIGIIKGIINRGGSPSLIDAIEVAIRREKDTEE